MVKTRQHPALRPAGFSPLLGGLATRDRALVNQLLDTWAGQGFTQVAPIQVDEAHTLLGGHSTEVQNRAFRFMDPQSGVMLALLPDVTLGIARLAAGELADAPRPLCLSYEGQAIRAEGSARRSTRQFGQVGLEVIGADDVWARRLMSAAIEALENLHVPDLHMSLVLPPLAGELIAEHSLPRELAQAVDRKDEGQIQVLAGDKSTLFLDILAGDLSGHPALEKLSSLQEDLRAQFPNVKVRCEPFEQRGFALQTGPAFALYSAAHQGELGRGGWYQSGGEACFGFTLYRDALLTVVPQ